MGLHHPPGDGQTQPATRSRCRARAGPASRCRTPGRGRRSWMPPHPSVTPARPPVRARRARPARCRRPACAAPRCRPGWTGPGRARRCCPGPPAGPLAGLESPRADAARRAVSRASPATSCTTSTRLTGGGPAPCDSPALSRDSSNRSSTSALIRPTVCCIWRSAAGRSSITSSSSPSASARSPASGVRRSCDMKATSSRRLRSRASSRSREARSLDRVDSSSVASAVSSAGAENRTPAGASVPRSVMAVTAGRQPPQGRGELARPRRHPSAEDVGQQRPPAATPRSGPPTHLGVVGRR